MIYRLIVSYLPIDVKYDVNNYLLLVDPTTIGVKEAYFLSPWETGVRNLGLT